MADPGSRPGVHGRHPPCPCARRPLTEYPFISLVASVPEQRCLVNPARPSQHGCPQHGCPQHAGPQRAGPQLAASCSDADTQTTLAFARSWSVTRHMTCSCFAWTAQEMLRWRHADDDASSPQRAGARTRRRLASPHVDEDGAILADALTKKAVSTTRSHAMQQTNLDIYGAEPIPWSRALDQLQDNSAKKTYWLATVRPDGQPHIAGVGALWLDEKGYFTSGKGARKSRHLAANPHRGPSMTPPDPPPLVQGTPTPAT